MSHPPHDATPALKCACGHFARADEVVPCRFCDCADHRPAYREPQDPVSAEEKLREFSDALEEAEDALKKARDEEVDAETARDKEKRRATLSPECPLVARNAFTVAYRDAWVADQIADEELAYKLARARRQAAFEHLRRLEKQGSFQQTISKSVGNAYQGTGGQRW